MDQATDRLIEASNKNTKQIMDHSEKLNDKTLHAIDKGSRQVQETIHGSDTQRKAELLTMEQRIMNQIKESEERLLLSAQKAPRPTPTDHVQFTSTASVSTSSSVSATTDTSSVANSTDSDSSEKVKKLEEELLHQKLENGKLQSELDLVVGPSKDPYRTPVPKRKRSSKVDARNEAHRKKHVAEKVQGRAQRAKEAAIKL